MITLISIDAINIDGETLIDMACNCQINLETYHYLKVQTLKQACPEDIINVVVNNNNGRNQD